MFYMRKFYSLFIALLAVCGLAKAQVTFDFSGDDAYQQFGLTGFSSSESGDGDITADASVTSGDVTITVSPCEGKNPNRMWTGSLRMYGGTLTIASKGKNITSVKFKLNSSKWGANNSADVGTLETGSWTGDASRIVITVTGNTQIKSMEVYLAGEQPTPSDDDWTSSAESPLTVAAVLEKSQSLDQGETTEKDVYVKGVITEIKSLDVSKWQRAQYVISDDAAGTNALLVYNGYYLQGAAFTADDQIKVGDEVIVVGKITNYKGTIEFAQDNKLYSLNGELGEEVKVPEYTKIADIKAAATATRTKVVYKAQEVLVTYVNGSSLYVYDGTDGLLLYGKNSGIKVGDKITVDAKGDLYLYNGLTEIAVSEYANQTVVSSDNEVTPQKVTIADVTNNYAQYENELVSIVELTPAAAAWDDQRCVSFVDDSDNTIVVRDNFQVAADLAFDTEKAYTVTGFVAVRATEDGSEYRIYPRSVADLDNGVTPEPFVAEGEGTMEKPYTIADVKGILANNLAAETPVWVHGFIVASANGSLDKLIFEGGDEAIPSNVMLAASKDATEKGDMIPVALPTGNVRAALNLKDNAANIGLEVWVYGTIEKYFSVAGVKNVTDFSLDGKTGVSDLNAASADKAIYNLAGQRLQTIGRSGLYIVGGKKMLVK